MIYRNPEEHRDEGALFVPKFVGEEGSLVSLGMS
jgi:hypothetical protein